MPGEFAVSINGAPQWGVTAASARRALRRGVDRTATAVRRAIIADIAGHSALPRRDVGAHVKVSGRTTATSLKAFVTIGKRFLKLSQFKPKTSKGSTEVHAYVDVRHGGRELYRVAFSPIGRSGPDSIFRRIRGRRSLRRVSGPSVAIMFGPGGDDLLRKQQAIAHETVGRELNVELLNVALRRFRGGRLS